MTRVPELMAAGVNVAFGHDCAMDPWYSLGSGDMLEVAHMGLHVAQMTSQAQMRACFDAVTVNGAKLMGLADHGLAPGKAADFVLLQAGDPVEAIRLRAQRLVVVRRGAVIASAAPQESRLMIEGRPDRVDWRVAPR
jgi:cytosine deaminase